MQRRLQQREVLNRRLLGQLDDNLVRCQAIGFQQCQGLPTVVLLFQQAFRGHVEKQLARQAKAAEAADRALAAEHFQFGQNAVVARGGEQGKRGVQRAVGWSAAESLKANDALFQGGNNGLEEGGDGGPIQDGNQGLTLF